MFPLKTLLSRRGLKGSWKASSALAIALCSLLWANMAWSMVYVVKSVRPTLKDATTNVQLIYATGVVTQNEGLQFSHFLATHAIQDNQVIYLNSPGGSLVGGLALGREIRRHHFITNVGVLDPRDSNRDDAGQCYSSCTLAYLGGVYRLLVDGSAFGVHRFSLSNGVLTGDEAQIDSAVVVNYLEDMGISNRFFELMTAASPQSILMLTKNNMRDFGILREYGKPTWEFVQKSGSIYLLGQLPSAYGTYKILVMCTSAKVAVIPMLPLINDAKMKYQGVNMFTDSGWTVLDDAEIQVKPMVVPGYLSAVVLLSPAHWSAFQNAKAVGFSFDAAAEPNGFRMDATATQANIASIVQGCH